MLIRPFGVQARPALILQDRRSFVRAIILEVILISPSHRVRRRSLLGKALPDAPCLALLLTLAVLQSANELGCRIVRLPHPLKRIEKCSRNLPILTHFTGVIQDPAGVCVVIGDGGVNDVTGRGALPEGMVALL